MFEKNGFVFDNRWVVPYNRFILMKNGCHINIEFVGGRIIEIHGRHGKDFPDGAVEIVPVWADTEQDQHMMYNDMKGWGFHASYKDADGTLDNPRLGFYYR